LYTKRTVEGSISGELRWRINNPSSLVDIRLENLAIRWPNTSPAIKLYQTLIDGSTELWSSGGQIPPSYSIAFTGNEGSRTFVSEATRSLNILFTRNLVVGHYNLLATFRNLSNDTTCTTSTGGYLAAPP